MATASFNPTNDTYVDEAYPAANYDPNSFCLVGVYWDSKNGNQPRRGLDEYDISSLSGHTIDAAEIRYNITLVTGASFAGGAYRCDSFVETDPTWNAQPAHDAASKVSWTSPVGTGVWTLSGLKDLVVDALTLRSGILAIKHIADNEAPGAIRWFRYASREDATYKPELVVTYDTLAAGRSYGQII